MPKLVNRPPKYRLHKSTGQAVVSIHGKIIQLGPFGSKRSHERYEKELEIWQERRLQEHPELDEPDEITISLRDLQARRRRGLPVTLNEIALLYEDHAHTYYVKNGKVTREGEQVSEMLRLMLRHQGEEELDEFGPVRLKELRERMIHEFAWSRKHINETVNRVRRLFAWACENELAAPSVHQALQTVAGLKKGRSKARETKPVTVVDDAIVDKTLPRLPEIVADMVRFQRLTGARPGEVCLLRPCDIDRSDEVWAYEPDAHKMEHYDTRRIIMIGPKAQQLLAPYLDRDEASYCFSPTESAWIGKRRQSKKDRDTPSTELLKRAHEITQQSGDPKPYEVAAYRLAIARGCVKASVTKWSPNRLRHTAATEVRKRFGLEAAQVVCGHQSADVTQIYAERECAFVRHTFDYEISLQNALREDEEQMTRDWIAAACQATWRETRYNSWRMSIQYDDNFGKVIRAFRFGTRPDRLDRVATHDRRRTTPPIGISIDYPVPTTLSLAGAFNELVEEIQDERELWVEIEFVNGERFGPHRHRLANRYGHDGTYASALKLLDQMPGKIKPAQLSCGQLLLDGLARLDETLVSIEWGLSAEQLDVSVDAERGGPRAGFGLANGNTISRYRRQLLGGSGEPRNATPFKQLPVRITNGLAHSVIHVPPHTEGVYLRGCLLEGKKTPVYYIPNEAPLPGFEAELVGVTPSTPPVRLHVYRQPRRGPALHNMPELDLNAAKTRYHLTLPPGRSGLRFSGIGSSRPRHPSNPSRASSSQGFTTSTTARSAPAATGWTRRPLWTSREPTQALCH